MPWQRNSPQRSGSSSESLRLSRLYPLQSPFTEFLPKNSFKLFFSPSFMGEKGKSGNPAHGPNSRFFQANDALVRGKKSKLLERFENLAARAGFSGKIV
jgi:hypothetical protein